MSKAAPLNYQAMLMIGIAMQVQVALTFPISGWVHLDARRSRSFVGRRPMSATEIVIGNVVISPRDTSVAPGYCVSFVEGGLTSPDWRLDWPW